MCAVVKSYNHGDGPIGVHVHSTATHLSLGDLLCRANAETGNTLQGTLGQTELRGKRRGTQTKTCG